MTETYQITRYRLAKMSAGWYCADGIECWLDLLVFVLDNDVVTTLELSDGEARSLTAPSYSSRRRVEARASADTPKAKHHSAA